MSANTAANDYIRTVNITPLGTSYSWDTPPIWITITQVGNTDEWKITVAANTGAARNATLTVRHANTSTVDTITVSQAGAGASPTATPEPTSTPVPTATPVPPTPTPAGTLVVLDTSVDPEIQVTQIFLSDFENGPGTASETYTWRYSGSGAATPVVVSKDNKVNVSFVYGTQVAGLVVGSITVASNDPGSRTPQSMTLNDLIIARPDDANVTHTIAMSLTQGTGNPFNPETD